MLMKIQLEEDEIRSKRFRLMLVVNVMSIYDTGSQVV